MDPPHHGWRAPSQLGKRFGNRRLADRTAVLRDRAQLAAILVLVVRPGDERECAGIEEVVQPLFCCLPLDPFCLAARRAQLRRIDIGDPRNGIEIVATGALCARRSLLHVA